MVACPICEQPVKQIHINSHLDSSCTKFIETHDAPSATQPNPITPKVVTAKTTSFFSPARRTVSFRDDQTRSALASANVSFPSTAPAPSHGDKRRFEDAYDNLNDTGHKELAASPKAHPSKRQKLQNAPLAERMRPQSLDDVAGQELVGPNGVLRNLIVSDRVPSMILWGGPGTGKTTIARLIAQTAGTRFVEINSTSSGVAECKKLFTEAKNELGLTGRKTIIFCDEIHRFSKSQQDVFLGPVEVGVVTLIGATTENPSFKVVSALLSRCRTFTLSKLTTEDVTTILKRALIRDVGEHSTLANEGLIQSPPNQNPPASLHLLYQDNHALLKYLAAFADGDARTALNLLELAIDLCHRPDTTISDLKHSLTQTLVYDRAGDQHYDTISAFHKSVRGSDPDATLYYLARMLQSGEDPLYVARRMVVIASEDVGLADNTLLPLATAAYAAAERIGMPECRINLAHCAVALALAPKSVRAYRGLNAAYAALAEPGIAGLPIPFHIRNAPTRLMKELGYGREYKYNPDFADGSVVQEYLPEGLKGRRFLGSTDLGDRVDEDLEEKEEPREVDVKVEEDEPVKRETVEHESAGLSSQIYVDDDGEVILDPDGD